MKINGLDEAGFTQKLMLNGENSSNAILRSKLLYSHYASLEREVENMSLEDLQREYHLLKDGGVPGAKELVEDYSEIGWELLGIAKKIASELNDEEIVLMKGSLINYEKKLDNLYKKELELFPSIFKDRGRNLENGI